MASPVSLEDLSTAARGLADHPQDHGWKAIYRLFDYGLHHSAPRLGQILLGSYERRPTSPTHLLTLLGIALKSEFPDLFVVLSDGGASEDHIARLEWTIAANADIFSNILLRRQNSFTCARRFLVPQVLLGAYFASQDNVGLRFADLGAGLGILARQLNSQNQYDYFSSELTWPGGVAKFRNLRLEAAHAIDRGPLPDLDWVRKCYGPSDYYSEMYQELLLALSDPDVVNAPVRSHALDIMDTEAVAEFLTANRINVANVTYVLYELPARRRADVIRAVADSLSPPGLLLVTEPCDELHRQGCIVELYEGGRNHRPLTLCFISDGHFKGHVIPLEDYQEFEDIYPIAY